MKSAVPVAILIGFCAFSGTACGGSGDDECVLSVECAVQADCPDGSRCNMALSPPACQKFYCGPYGSDCSENGFCVTKSCNRGTCVMPDDPDDTDGTVCSVNLDCPAGSVCDNARCVERVCETRSDCGPDEFCLEGEWFEKGFEWNYCTAPLCDDNRPCTNPEETCTGGVCLMVIIGHDVIEGAGGESDPGPRGEIVVPAEDIDCRKCESVTDCAAGYECKPLTPKWSYCLRGCWNDGDCPKGLQCQVSGGSRVCIYWSMGCGVCAYDKPCDEGWCCDGSRCSICMRECEPCVYDEQCADGLRCTRRLEQEIGVCALECKNTPCPNPSNQACTDNGRGVMLCNPTGDECVPSQF